MEQVTRMREANIPLEGMLYSEFDVWTSLNLTVVSSSHVERYRPVSRIPRLYD